MNRLVMILGLLSQILHVFGQPIVRVEQGEIQGKTVPFRNEYLEIDKDIDIYLGIPYAEPPVGEGRFSPPLPKEPWAEDEVYNATYNRDICVQNGLDALYFSQSEDCLHLNVYAPNPKVSLIKITGVRSGLGYKGCHIRYCRWSSQFIYHSFMHASKAILNLPTSSLHPCSPFQQNRKVKIHHQFTSFPKQLGQDSPPRK